VAEHESILAQTHEQAALERERLVAEHDSFIAMLVADHERELQHHRLRPPPLPKSVPPELPKAAALPELPRPILPRPSPPRR
jgi:hypothetical protein